uniref:Ricin B-type lectin domain-containing protein n=1 Tax=Parastrongyloides trichosuri TaxID=131310 RepID=A0A0N4ZZX3_PARTI
MFEKIIYLLFTFGAFTNCNPFESAQYSDDLARHKMIGFAAASYLEDASVCTKNIGNNTILIRQVTVGCDLMNNDTCSAFVAVDHTDKAIVIAHRGSISYLQESIEVIETLFDKKEPFPSGGGVSRYFYDAWSLVWSSGLRDAFLTAKNKNPDYDVWVTGHSLGAAMASLSAANIGYHQYVPKDRLMSITFGEPRVGDVDYAKGYDAVVGYSYRVIHHRDPIPHVPFKNMMDYQHTKVEVFYDNDMTPGSNYTICSTSDDTENCSNQYWDFQHSDHSLYFKSVHSIQNSKCLNLYP